MSFPPSSGFCWRCAGLTCSMSGAVRMETCCWRPPALLPRLINMKEYSVSGCRPLISFFLRWAWTSTLCWLYRIYRERMGRVGYSREIIIFSLRVRNKMVGSPLEKKREGSKIKHRKGCINMFTVLLFVYIISSSH